MNSKKIILTVFILIIFIMLVVTVWASTFESVFVGGKKILDQPWGVATFADAYFAFLIFYVWVFYKQANWASKIVWFILIMAFGNISMAAYVILQIYRLPPGAPVHQILLRPHHLGKI